MPRWRCLAHTKLDSQSGCNTGYHYGGLLCLSGVLKQDSEQITEFRLLVAEPFFSHLMPRLMHLFLSRFCSFEIILLKTTVWEIENHVYSRSVDVYHLSTLKSPPPSHGRLLHVHYTHRKMSSFMPVQYPKEFSYTAFIGSFSKIYRKK